MTLREGRDPTTPSSCQVIAKLAVRCCTIDQGESSLGIWGRRQLLRQETGCGAKLPLGDRSPVRPGSPSAFSTPSRERISTAAGPSFHAQFRPSICAGASTRSRTSAGAVAEGGCRRHSRLPAAPARERNPPGIRGGIPLFSSVAWLVLAGARGHGAYFHFNHPADHGFRPARRHATRVEQKPVAKLAENSACRRSLRRLRRPPCRWPIGVRWRLSSTAREESWVQVTADGKAAFTATLQPNETRTVGGRRTGESCDGKCGRGGDFAERKDARSAGPVGPGAGRQADGGRSAVRPENSAACARSALALRRARRGFALSGHQSAACAVVRPSINSARRRCLTLTSTLRQNLAK